MGKEKNYILRCFSCGKESHESQSYTSCSKCKGPLEVECDYGRISEKLNTHVLKSAPMRATKYLDFYPLASMKNVFSLNEGGTPLYRCHKLGRKVGLKSLWIKFEGTNPTGGFKDRGSLVEIAKAIELGAKNVICASTGNMAASLAAYSAVAEIPCYVIVPEGTPLGKMAQTLAFGARVVQVRGSYDDAARLAVGIAKNKDFYLAGDYAFRLEGQKSQAYEIIEQLGWKSPDKMIVPVGNGTNASAVWKGFKEFNMLGFAESLPGMVAVQPENVSPIVRAFRGNCELLPIEKPSTIASAVCVGNPSDACKVLQALRESNGSAAAAREHEILEAQKLLAKTESIFVEPSGALPFAALQNMVAAGEVDADEEIVMLMTGAGLKDPLSLLKILPSPPTVEPELEAVKKLLDYDYYKICAEMNSGQGEVLVSSAPDIASLGSIIFGSFEIKMPADDLRFCLEQVKEFLQKGKALTKNDLKLIVEEAMQRGKTMENRKKELEILDFEVSTSRHAKPSAFVKVRVHGTALESTAFGVGPVDAIINAVKSCVKGKLDFELIDYRVQINTENTDATVDVRITMKDSKGNRVIAMGASPDIMVASVNAFEQGYNLLHAKSVSSASEGAVTDR